MVQKNSSSLNHKVRMFSHIQVLDHHFSSPFQAVPPRCPHGGSHGAAPPRALSVVLLSSFQFSHEFLLLDFGTPGSCISKDQQLNIYRLDLTPDPATLTFFCRTYNRVDDITF